MNTRTSLAAAGLAALLLAGFTACQSSPSVNHNPPPAGPATGAALLSSKKTFDLVGRTGKKVANAEPTDPADDIAVQAVRSTLESRGYQYQPGSPDFLVSVAWNEHTKAEQPTPATPPAGQSVGANNMVDTADLGIVVRDSVSGTILWRSPVGEPLEYKTVTSDQARALATKALADFPPSQAGK